MGGISIWQLIIILFIFLIPLFVFGPVARKAGYSRWWALLLAIPIINIVLIWAFAFIKWPAESNA